MIAMIFEFWMDPDPAVQAEYHTASARLRAELASMEGFRGVEGFESCSQPGKYVAVGFFDDEEAVAAWRNQPQHRQVQRLGRERFFSGYRLRMAEVVRDYGPEDRAQAPADSRAAHG